MKKNRVVLIYTLLAFMFIGSAVLLAYQVRHLLKEREDPTTPFLSVVKPVQEMQEIVAKQEQQEKSSINLTFTRTNSFRPIATQVPRPTPTPRPLPTPTPVQVAKNWKINFVLKNSASITKYDGSMHIVSVGQVLEDQAFGNFEIVELIPDPTVPKVKVKHIQSGSIGFIDQQ